MDTKKLKHGKKFKLLGSQTCAICIEEMTGGLVLHKTQRQTHMICFNCAEPFIVNQLENNILEKKYTNSIVCSGTFHGNKRNRCKQVIDINKLNIPPTIEKVHNLIARTVALNFPGATECISGICANIILVPENIEIVNCPDCQIIWCHKCKVTPYHEGMSCQKYKIMNDSTPESLHIRNMILEGEIKLCSTCNWAIQRNGGCNKLTCSQCKDAMCWLCGKGKIGYDHFQRGSCNQKLFNH